MFSHSFQKFFPHMLMSNLGKSLSHGIIMDWGVFVVTSEVCWFGFETRSHC